MKKIVTGCILLLLIGSTNANAQFRRKAAPCSSQAAKPDTNTINVAAGQTNVDITAFTGGCYAKRKENIIRSGQVTSSDGVPVSFATIKIPGTGIGTVADSNGNYSLSIPFFAPSVLEFYAVGHKTKTFDWTDKGFASSDDIILEATGSVYSSIEIISPRLITCRSYTCRIQCLTNCGGIKITRNPTVIDSINVSDVQIIVFPNPAPKGSTVSIRTTGIESPSFKLVDNQSKTITAIQTIESAKTNVLQLTLPASIAAGMYYIVATDSKSKKQYTRKLIIQ